MFPSRNSRLACFLFVTLAFLFTVQPVSAAVTSFNVPVGEEVTKTMNLAVEDHVSIRLTTVNQENNGILDFKLTYPNGAVKVDYGNVGNVNYAFVCDVEGEYLLHFANVGSSEDVLVSLNYEIEHYIWGMPQTLFLTMIIAAVCVLAVVVFALMGKS